MSGGPVQQPIAGVPALSAPLRPDTTTPDDAVAPPPHHPRFPLLDGMRAVAVFSVLILHVGVFGVVGDSFGGRLVMHMNVGVTIFFLISGFLLYRPFIAHRTGGAPAPAGLDYAKRRLLRIVPAYWLVLIVLVLAPGVLGVPGSGGLQQFALIHTLPVGDGPACIAAVSQCGLAQTWSLVVEVTFYALLPFYALAAAALARGRSVREWLPIELLLLGALAIGSMILRFVLLDGPGPTTVVGGTLLGYWLWFALGMALALISVALAGLGWRPAAIDFVGAHPSFVWLAAAAIYVAAALILPATPYLIGVRDQLLAHVAFGAVALLLMLPAVFGDDEGGAPRTFLEHPLIAWLGLVSYGIFLWHYVIALELGLPGEGLAFAPLLVATVAITVPIAAASYYLVERPLLRFKYRRFDVRGLIAADRRRPAP
jgi:peptidoglycan/LPS O-acetylase OafA/YrhL